MIDRSRKTCVFYVTFAWCAFNTFNSLFADSNPNACMNQPYKTGAPPDIKELYMNEFSKLDFVKKKIQRFFCLETKEASTVDDKMTKELCACAMYKKQEKINSEPKVPDDNENIIPSAKSQPFEEILKNTDIRRSRITVPVWYTIFPISHKFPAIMCICGDVVFAVLKGLKKQSKDRPLYNIYVGDLLINDEKFKYQGVINDVDIEIPAQSKAKMS